MITQKMIAEKLGVSIGTVSLALRNSPLLNKQTAKKIRDFAREVNYRPSNIGRALQSGKSRLIGCLMYSILPSFYNEVLEGIAQTVTQSGYELITSFPKPDEVVQHIEKMLIHHIDGLIITMERFDDDVFTELEQVRKSGIPVIFCSSHHHRDFPFVVTDDFSGGKIAIQHLAQTGHQNLIISHCEYTHSREEGFIEAAGEAHLDYTLMLDESDLIELVCKHHADAIVCSSDMQAISFLRALKASHIRCPEDISIIGYDDIPLASFPEFNLTTVSQQKIQLGQQAVGYIVNAADHKDISSERTYLMPSLVRRSTVINRR